MQDLQMVPPTNGTYSIKMIPVTLGAPGDGKILASEDLKFDDRFDIEFLR